MGTDWPACAVPPVRSGTLAIASVVVPTAVLRVVVASTGGGGIILGTGFGTTIGTVTAFLWTGGDTSAGTGASGVDVAIYTLTSGVDVAILVGCAYPKKEIIGIKITRNIAPMA